MGKLILSETILSETDKQYLERLVSEAHLATHRRGAQILLLYAQNLPTRQIAARVGISSRGARYWREAFARKGMAIFPVLDPTPGRRPPVGDLLSSDLLSSDLLSSDLLSQEASLVTGIEKERPKSPGLLPDDPMAEAGRKIMHYYFAEMLRWEAGTRQGEDIEHLHDMRVASRRLRAVFDVFGEYFMARAIKSYMKDLRATGRILGQVRDLDVFMAKVRGYLQTLAETEQNGLAPLLDLWDAKRQEARALMIAHLDSARYQAFIEQFGVFLNSPGEGAKVICVAGCDRKSRREVASQGSASQPIPTVQVVAPILIYTRMAAVRAYEKRLEKASIEQLHALRTEFKRFRYTIEFFREVLGSEAKSVISDLKAIQDHLGELHDADVACGILSDFLNTWEARQSTLSITERHSPEPIVAYLAAKHAERHQLLVTFPEAWERFNHPEFRQNLALSVSVL